MINNPDYKWYVIKEQGSRILITSGWEYRSDAKDFRIENGGKIVSKRICLQIHLDPNINSNWSKGI